MKVLNIQGIKKVFLENKEITNIKHISYAQNNPSFDNAIKTLASVSSALFIANVTMNANKNQNDKDGYITEKELLEILKSKTKFNIPYLENYAKACVNKFGLIKKDIIPQALKLLEPARQSLRHCYLVENIKDKDGNIQTKILEWFDARKDDFDKYAITKSLSIIKDSDGICDEKAFSLFRKYKDGYNKYNFPEEGELEFCKDKDGTFSQEKIDIIVRNCTRRGDYEYLSGAVDSNGKINENLLVEALSTKFRWENPINRGTHSTRVFPFKELLPYITKDGKYSKEMLEIISYRFLAYDYPHSDILDILKHLQSKYGEMEPIIARTFAVFSPEGKKYIEKLKQKDLSSEEGTTFLKNLYAWGSNGFDHNRRPILKAYLQAETPEEYKLLNDMLTDENLSHFMFRDNYCSNIKEALPLYYSSLPDEYIYHRFYKQDIPIDFETYEKYSQKFDELASLKKRIIKHPPQQFENAESINRANALDWFTINYIKLADSIDYLDDITLDYLMLYRANGTVDAFFDLSKDEKILYSNLINPKNNNGKIPTTKEKTGLINILSIYKTHEIPMYYIYDMVDKKDVDIKKIEIDFIKQILKENEYKLKSITDEQLAILGINNAVLLADFIARYEDCEIGKELFKGLTSSNFKNYILNKSNTYKETNAEVKRIFKTNSLNYDLWLNPRKENEVKFVTIDNNKGKLRQIAKQISEDMNTLLQTQAKSFIEKQFREYVKDDQFIIPERIASNQNLLKELVENLANDTEKGQLYQIWKRASDNLGSTELEKVTRAKNVITVLNHLNQRVKDVKQVQVDNSVKECDWTIKIWDRNPLKDLFQGNYSTCCIGIGECNEEFMPQYLLNTTFNMIEIADNKTGDIVGNALCYIAIVNSKPAFIIDNIEIKNSEKLSNEESINLRNAITKYAENVAKDITGNNKTLIYLGDAYNDIETSDITIGTVNKRVCILGNLPEEGVYLDALGGYIETNGEIKNKTACLYKLN